MQGTQKQIEALQVLTDSCTKEVFYGGAAGGGKSYLGCFWLILMCSAYPKSRWFIARQELKRIRQSTVISFAKVAKSTGVSYRINGQDNYIELENGSRIDLLDVRYMPGDPLYERFGSTEYTGGWIEEAGETNFGAYDVLKSRMGRHLNDTFGIISKLLVTCNPKKNWLYTDVYKPWREGTLQKHIRFIPALVKDNPYLSADYIENLENLKDKGKKERLLRGNWEYDDDPTTLCAYDSIVDIFTNPEDASPKYYVTADVARMGSDKAIIAAWKGWTVIEFIIFEKSRTTDIQKAIKTLQDKYKIGSSNCVADEDGVGGGVVDNLHIKGFLNNGKPFDNENYQNLQAQCCYLLAEKINDNSLSIKAEVSPAHRLEIIEELEQLKTYEADSDRKLRILPKEEIKKNIGRSPDWRDMLMMRAYFEYKITVRVPILNR